MFLALIRKDVRILRPAWLGAVGMSVAAYFVLCPYVFWYVWSDRPGNRPFEILMVVGGAALYSLVLGTVFAAVCAGAVAPTERRERWADFLAMLPVSRQRLVAARAVSAAAIFLAAWGTHAIVAITVMACADRLKPIQFTGGELLASRNYSIPLTLIGSAAASLAMFGIAWLMAAFLRSAALAGGISIAGVVGGLVATMIIAAGAQLANEEPLLKAYLATASVVGVLCGAIGTVAQLRRIEP